MISISYILRYWKISAWSWFIVGRPQIEGLFCGMSSQIMSHQLSNTNSRRARKSLRLNYPALLCINNSKSMPSQTFPNQLIYLYHISLLSFISIWTRCSQLTWFDYLYYSWPSLNQVAYPASMTIQLQCWWLIFG